MHTRFAFAILLMLGACSGDKSGTEGCEPLSEGDWSMSGSCFGMDMTGALTLDADGCSFTFSDWDMAMSVPEGGTVSGADVTLTGAEWDTCTGTTDGTSISGSCDDGCTYDMVFAG